MFALLSQSRNRQAGVDARVSTMQSNSCVTTIPATHFADWTFGYAKPHQRPPEPSQ